MEERINLTEKYIWIIKIFSRFGKSFKYFYRLFIIGMKYKCNKKCKYNYSKQGNLKGNVFFKVKLIDIFHSSNSCSIIIFMLKQIPIVLLSNETSHAIINKHELQNVHFRKFSLSQIL